MFDAVTRKMVPVLIIGFIKKHNLDSRIKIQMLDAVTPCNYLRYFIKKKKQKESKQQ